MLKSRVKYYVTFTDEIDELAEGHAEIFSDRYTVKQAEKEARDYLKSKKELSGVILNFHHADLYDRGMFEDSELESRLITR